MMNKQQWVNLRNNIQILMFGLALQLLATKATAQTIKLGTGTNPDPPFVNSNFQNSERYPGITIDLLRLIESRLNVRIEIIQKPWARVNEDIRFNRLDGGFHFSYLASRNSYLSYPTKSGEPLPNKQYAISLRSDVLFRLKGNSISWDGSTFSKPGNNRVSLGVIRSGAIATQLKNKNYDLIEVNSNSQLIELLVQKRVDGIIGLKSMIEQRIKTLPSKIGLAIEATKPEVSTTHFFVAFSNKFASEHKQLIWRIWAMIDELNQDGTLDALRSKYQKLDKQLLESNKDIKNN